MTHSLGSAAPELWTLATCEQPCDRASLQEDRQETEASPSFLRRTMGIQGPSDEKVKAWPTSVLHGDIQVIQRLVGRSKEENQEHRWLKEAKEVILFPRCPSSGSKWALLRCCPPQDGDPGKAFNSRSQCKVPMTAQAFCLELCQRVPVCTP